MFHTKKLTSRAYFRTQRAAIRYSTAIDCVKYVVYVLPANKMLLGAENGFVVITINKIEALRKVEMEKLLARRKRMACSACRYGRCHAHHPRHARRNPSLWGF